MSDYAFLQNKAWQFWMLQLLGWSGWGVSTYLGVVFSSTPPPYYSLYIATVSLFGLLITLGLRQVFHFIWDMREPRRLLLALASALVAAAIWIALRRYLFAQLFPQELEGLVGDHGSLMYLLRGIISAFWVMLVWSILYFGIKYYLLLQQEREQHLRLAGIAHETQLKMLRYQLNPHFLFNTLNAISTLVMERQNELAAGMVQRLSSFLRHSLDSDPMQKVTVAQEIEMLSWYLDIEKVRFEERLQLHIDIAPEAERALLPSMLLQPLVENAIKYAVAVSPKGGSIGISASIEDEQLVLQVADDGPGLKPQVPDTRRRSSGVGISNIRERLRELYGKRQSLRLSATEPHGLTVTICLPLQIGSGA